MPAKGYIVLRRLKSYAWSIRKVWLIDTNRRSTRIARFLLRSCKNPIALVRWLDLINQQPELRFWCAHSPRLFIKPSRHYINRNYSFADRAKRIESHYDLLQSLVSQKTIAALATGQLISLAEFCGKSGDTYRIVLRKTDKFDREGELGLVLLNVTLQCNIYFLIFSLNDIHRERTIEIGCLQGTKGERSQDLIRTATKDACGNRPKMLLTETVYVFANAWRVKHVLGVSNDLRIFNSARTFADYNAFWSEIGASPDQNGMFRLPTVIRHRDEFEIESKHRSAHRKKMTLLDTLKRAVASSVELF